MVTNVAGRRYRTCYAMLLRLYPRPFRDQFGEGMAQTFHDLCQEPSDAGWGLFGLALWIFFETSGGIIMENVTRRNDDTACGAGGAGTVDGAVGGIAVRAGMELERG
jgi:hypothetical protein